MRTQRQLWNWKWQKLIEGTSNCFISNFCSLVRSTKYMVLVFLILFYKITEFNELYVYTCVYLIRNRLNTLKDDSRVFHILFVFNFDII